MHFVAADRKDVPWEVEQRTAMMIAYIVAFWTPRIMRTVRLPDGWTVQLLWLWCVVGVASRLPFHPLVHYC